MSFPIRIYQDEDGVFIGEFLGLGGVGTFGATIDELFFHLEEVLELYFEVHS